MLISRNNNLHTHRALFISGLFCPLPPSLMYPYGWWTSLPWFQEVKNGPKIGRKHISTVIWSINVAIPLAKHVQIVDTLPRNVCLIIRKYFLNILSWDNNGKRDLYTIFRFGGSPGQQMGSIFKVSFSLPRRYIGEKQFKKNRRFAAK